MWTTTYEIGKHGTEGGVIIKDEIYKGACRITLERDCDYSPYVITCGIFGSFCHTAFCNEEDNEKIYNAMKVELQEFIDTKTSLDEELEFYSRFSEKY